MWFPKIKPKKNKAVAVDKRELDGAIQEALEPYLKREDLQDFLHKIEKDERKKKLWDSMSSRKKIKLLRYVAERRERGKK